VEGGALVEESSPSRSSSVFYCLVAPKSSKSLSTLGFSYLSSFLVILGFFFVTLLFSSSDSELSDEEEDEDEL
jgi:hypothetical protein